RRCGAEPGMASAPGVRDARLQLLLLRPPFRAAVQPVRSGVQCLKSLPLPGAAPHLPGTSPTDRLRVADSGPEWLQAFSAGTLAHAGERGRCGKRDSSNHRRGDADAAPLLTSIGRSCTPA